MKNFGESLLIRFSCLQGDEAVSALKLSPIDLVAIVLEVETPTLFAEIDQHDVIISGSYDLKEHYLSRQWKSYWNKRIRTEATVRSLRAALASEKWSKAPATQARNLLQEYHMILDRLLTQGEYIREGVQQIQARTSIEETRKGIQQSDSVRRLGNLSLLHYHKQRTGVEYLD